MKLHEIIDALKNASIEEVLNKNQIKENYGPIYLYAEYSVNVDTDYILLKNTAGKDYIKNEKGSFEKLCSLEELSSLVKMFSKQYPKKDSKTLVIDVIDHIENGKY